MRTVIAIAVVSMVACSSGPEAEPDDPAGHDALTGEHQTASEETVDNQREESADETEADEPPGYWWGPIQGRADEAFDELEQEIGDCLRRLGEDTDIREIGLEATRKSGAEPYELVEVTSHPGSAEAHGCVEEVARDYVDAVGVSLVDEFDTWVATFVHRGAPVETDGCGEVPDDTVCRLLDVGGSDESRAGAEVDECGDDVVESINQSMRNHPECWSGARVEERLEDYEDEPIALRAVMVGDVVVEDGRAAVMIRFNRPWVEPMATCFVDRLLEVEPVAEMEGGECRSTLSNRAVHPWFGPSFSYVVE